MSFSPASRTITVGSGDEIANFRAAGGGMLASTGPEGDAAKTLPKYLPVYVLYPNGGETWEQGKAYNIRWTEGGYGTLKIALYRSHQFLMWITEDTPHDGSYWWKVPASMPPDNSYKIKIRRGAVVDFSDGCLTIAEAPLVTYPNGAGVSWWRGQSYKIQWQGFGGSHVKIQLYRAGSLNRLISWSTPNDGQFWWKLPWTTTPGPDYRIRVISANDPTQKDHSNNNFSVSPVRHVNYPTKAGITWWRGQTYTVKWSGFTESTVRIVLTQGGFTVKDLSSATANDGRFVWKVSDDVPAGGDYRIAVMEYPTKGFGEGDVSDNPFQISIPQY